MNRTVPDEADNAARISEQPSHWWAVLHDDAVSSSEQRSMRLADGSQVTLNTTTRIEVGLDEPNYAR